MTIKSLLSSKSEATNRHGYTDREIDEYMQMAARMLFDIIHDWRERHPESGTQATQNSNHGKRKKDL